MKTKKCPTKLKKITPSEHLAEYLKSTHLDRLNWLEEANRFAKRVIRKKKH